MKNLLRKAQGWFRRRDRIAALERRRIPRLACHQSFVCHTGQREFLVTVVDLGFGGFKIRSAVPVGERGVLLHLRRVSADSVKRLGGSYTTGLMARVAWTKQDQDGWESGLCLPDAPGSMRIRWYKELLAELEIDEKSVFSRRANRRHRCRLPATISTGALPSVRGMVCDLSSGGALWAAPASGMVGSTGRLVVQWGVHQLDLEVTIVGVRPAEVQVLDLPFLHSLRFQGPLPVAQESVLHRWLEELARDQG